MKLTPFFLSIAAAVFALAAAPSTAHAQASRTWVSGTGDDANPCSRTAPCKTWVGAYTKTAPGGEINAIDAGGFGPITISHSISIVGDGTLSSTLGAGTNGFIVNAPAGERVVLRGIDIEGAGSGVNGIRMLGGGTLVVEKCRINNFSAANGNGIDFEPSVAGAELVVSECVITHNLNGNGILVKPSGVSANVSIEKTTLANNSAGLRVENGGVVLAKEVSSLSNTNAGFNILGSGQANLTHCVASNNEMGIRALLGTVRISDCTVTNNSADGLAALSGGSILSFQDNKVAGNNPDGSPTGSIALK